MAALTSRLPDDKHQRLGTLTQSQHATIKAVANARDAPYQSLIKVWLQEKVTTG